MPINWWMDSQNAVYPFNEVLLSHKKKGRNLIVVMIAQFCEWQGIHFKNRLHRYRLGQAALAEVYMRKFWANCLTPLKQDVSPHFIAFTHAIFLSEAFFIPTPYSMFLSNCCLSSGTHPARQLFLKVFPDLTSIHYLTNIGNFPLEFQSSLHLPWPQPLSPPHYNCSYTLTPCIGSLPSSDCLIHSVCTIPSTWTDK